MQIKASAKSEAYCSHCGWYGNVLKSDTKICPVCKHDYLYLIQEGRLLVVCMHCKGVIRFKDGEGETGVSHGAHPKCVLHCGYAREDRQEMIA